MVVLISISDTKLLNFYVCPPESRLSFQPVRLSACPLRLIASSPFFHRKFREKVIDTSIPDQILLDLPW